MRVRVCVRACERACVCVLERVYLCVRERRSDVEGGLGAPPKALHGHFEGRLCSTVRTPLCHHAPQVSQQLEAARKGKHQLEQELRQQLAAAQAAGSESQKQLQQQLDAAQVGLPRGGGMNDWSVAVKGQWKG